MDLFDQKLLDALQRDGRMTNQELADRVGLSASQCSRRRMALEASGAIKGYHAALDPESVGLAVTAFIQVTFAAHSAESAERFKRLIQSLDEVQEAFALTGQHDYVMKVVLPDLPALAQFINGVLLPHKAVGQVNSSIVLDRVKSSGLLPIAARNAKGGRP